MVTEPFDREISAFVREMEEPLGIDVEKVTPAVAAQVQHQYLPIASGRDEALKRSVLQELQAAWQDNQDHKHSRRFGRAAGNLATFCLRPTRVDELSPAELRHAIDAVVRISRWYHTDNNLWLRFQPYARRAVELLWGSIERW